MQEQKANGKAKNAMYYINSAICVFIMFGFGALPTIQPLTDVGMDVLGIFIGMLYGWVCVDVIWPSLFGMLALATTGLFSVAEIMKAGFGNDTVLIIFFVSIFAAYVSISGLNVSIAHWFVTRKICVGRPWVLLAMVMLSAFVISACGAQYGALIIMWSVFYKICDSFGVKKKDGYAAIGVIGIVMAISLGADLFLFYPHPTIVMGMIAQVVGTQIDFLTYTVCAFLMIMADLGAYLLAAKFILRPDVSKIKNASSEYLKSFEVGKLPRSQKLAGFFLILLVVLMCAPSLLPKSWPLQQLLQTWGMLGCAILVVIIVCAIRVNGEPLVRFPQLAKEGVPWEVIVLFASIMAMSAAIQSPEVGIMDALVALLSPALTGLTPTMFIIVAAIAGTLLTQVVPNMVLAVVVTPLIAELALSVGANPMVLGIILVQCLQLALMTPGASAQAAMMYGNEWVSKKQAYVYTALTILVCTLATLASGFLLGGIFFPAA